MNDTELYYAHPVQVRYWDAECHNYYGGIAYHDWLIDGHNGEAKHISIILKEAKNDGKDVDQAIIELNWISLNKAVLGL